MSQSAPARHRYASVPQYPADEIIVISDWQHELLYGTA